MSNEQIIIEVLSAHADHLLADEHHSADYAALFPDEEGLPPLLNLADHVRTALQPVNLNPAFRDQLHRDLLAAHAQATPQPPQAERPRLWATIIGGLIAVLGLMLVFRRQQFQPALETEPGISLAEGS